MTNQEQIIMQTPEIAEQKEAVKIFKNTKGYNWELKIIPNPNLSKEEKIKRLKEEIEVIEEGNVEMMKKFGSLEA